MKRLGIALLLVAFCSILVHAQSQPSSTVAETRVPRLVPFSGMATDVNGKPLTGVVGITFSIYKDQQGGAPLWIETQNVSPNSGGHYTVTLGATKSDGIPADLFTSGEARWVGVQVQGQVEQSRVQVMSVPYAMKAVDAETVGGLPASAFVLAAPAGGPAATSNESTAATPPVTGTTPVTTAGGAGNYLAKFDAAADITNSIIYDTGTRVGINTTTPGSTLDVKGGGTIRGTLALPATGTAISTAGKNSQPLNLSSSVFSSSTSKALNETFRWQVEPVPSTNNTANPLSTLNLLFGSGTNKPSETGLGITSNGLINFAPGQPFPGTGTVTSVSAASGSGLTVSNPTTTPQIGTNFYIIQKHLSASCSAGQFLQGINTDGSPLCAAPSFSLPSGLSVLGSSPVAPPGFTVTGFVAASGKTPWRQAASLNTGREGLGVAVVGSKIFAVGGYNNSSLSSLEQYDTSLANPSWTVVTPLNGSFTARDLVAVAASSAAVSTGAMYAFGGESAGGASSLVDMYNPATNTWTSKATLPGALYGHCAVSDSAGFIYIMGGFNGSTFSSALYKYDPVNNVYSVLAPMPTAVYIGACAIYNNTIYFVGGRTSSLNYTNATQIYNIASNSWTTGVPAPTPLFGASATIIGSQVYVVGGYSSNLGLLSTLYIYDPATNTWISGPPTPSLHYVFGSASVKNLLYAVGGYNGPAYSAEVDVYDPTAVRFIYAAN